MKTKLFFGTQIIAGVLLLLFGLNGFLQFLSMPPANAPMTDFTTSVYKTGYIFPLMAFFEIVTAISFLTNKYVSLMSVLIMPFMINALLSHMFLDMNGIAPSALIVLATIVVMIKNKESFSLIFKA